MQRKRKLLQPIAHRVQETSSVDLVLKTNDDIVTGSATDRSALFVGFVACVWRKLDSAILMVKTAEDRSCDDDAEALNRAMERGVLV